jgi:hypothetical protein
VETLAADGTLEYGFAELCFNVCGTAIGLGALAWCLVVSSRTLTRIVPAVET